MGYIQLIGIMLPTDIVLEIQEFALTLGAELNYKPPNNRFVKIFEGLILEDVRISYSGEIEIKIGYKAERVYDLGAGRIEVDDSAAQTTHDLLLKHWVKIFKRQEEILSIAKRMKTGSEMLVLMASELQVELDQLSRNREEFDKG